jgi:hypothetical protein
MQVERRQAMTWICILIFCLLGVEEWRELDIIDSNVSKKVKRYCYIRIGIAAVIAIVLILIVYKAYGANDYNYLDCLSK